MSNTIAQGTAGDRAIKTILEGMGWSEVADLARTYPGADLLCIRRYFEDEEWLREDRLWVEVKTYSWRQVKPESRLHIKECAQLHAPDPHLTVCRQNDLANSGLKWRVVTVNGDPWPEGKPAPLLIGFKLAYPAHLDEPPYTTGDLTVHPTGKKPRKARGGHAESRDISIPVKPGEKIEIEGVFTGPDVGKSKTRVVLSFSSEAARPAKPVTNSNDACLRPGA